MSDATNLTTAQIADLRVRADRSSFIDPVSFRKVREASFHREWAEVILGGPYVLGRLSAYQIDLLALALALDAEPARPVPAAEQTRRDAAERASREYERTQQQRVAAERVAWHALRDRLPVAVTVGHNWTIGHYDGHVTGKDHIVVQAELRVGRLHRNVQQVLCETPSKTRSQQSRRGNTNPLRHVERGSSLLGDDLIPTCAACLKIANRIASTDAGE